MKIPKGQNHSSSPTLDALLHDLRKAQRTFREQLAQSGLEPNKENPAKEIYQQIAKFYPDFYPKLKEIEINEAIELLKTEGYKVLKKVETVEYEET